MPFDVAGALGAGYSPQEITDYLAATPSDAEGFNVNGALKAGYSPAEIVDHLNPNVARQSAQGTPILAPIQRGIAGASSQAANLADDLGFHSTAADIRSRIPQADLTAPTAAGSMVSDLRAGHIGSALADAPSAALEQFVPVAGSLAGGLIAGPAALVGRLGVGAGIGAVTQGDQIARQRAANNGRTTPDASDLAIGLGGGGAAGAAGSIGLGGAGAGLAGAAGAVIKHGLADAAQPELAALAGSVGTQSGTQNASVPDMAASALTGLATRAGMAAPDLVRGGLAMTPSGRTAAAQAQFDALSPADQARMTDLASASQAISGVQDDAMGLKPATPAAAARQAAQGLAGRVTDLADTLDKQGALPDGGTDTISTALKAALDPNGVLTKTHLSDIGALGLDPQTTGLIGSALGRINTLSDPTIASRTPGPVESFMSGPAATLIGGGVGSMAGLPGTAMGALIGHQVLRPALAATTGRIGAMVDRMMGTASPSVLSQAKNAAALLDAAGVAVPDTASGLQQAMSASNDVIATQARLMGLDPAKALTNGLAATQDAAAGDQFKLAYSDALAMNRQATTAANQQRALQVSDASALDAQRTAALNQQRSLDVGDATAMDRQMNAQRGLQVQDATAMDAQRTAALNGQRSLDVADAGALDRQMSQQRAGQMADASALDAQRTAALNAQRGFQVGDAQAINAARMRGMNLSEAEGGKVAMMALQRAAALKAMQSGTTPTGSVAGGAATPKDATGPLSGQGPVDPIAAATARTIAANPGGPTATKAALDSLSAPQPGVGGLNADALLHGQLLPDWQWGIGNDVMKALHLRGTPANLSPARVSQAAVASLQGAGMFSPAFGSALMGHSGRVVRGLYNVIRNEALLAHGVDHRTLEAQQAAAATPGLAMAAE